MRLLHARHDHHRPRAVERGAGRRCRPRPRGAVGQHLPLHRLYLDRGSGAGCPRLLPEDRRAAMRNSFIGSAVERREDLRFVRGRGQYVDDLHRDGLLHAVILRSSVAHGRIRSIDGSAALKIEGVHAVITGKDMPGGPPVIPMRLQPLPEFKPFEQAVIADRKVRYVGEPLAVVLAASAAIGEDALEHIAVDIEPLPAVTDWEVAAQGERLLFEPQGTNRAMIFTAQCGDADAAFRTAPYVRRERFRTSRHYGSTLEPRGVLAEWDEGSGRVTESGGGKGADFKPRR